MPWLQRLREAFRRYSPVAGRWLPWIGGVLMLLAAAFGVSAWQATQGLVRTSATVTENVSSFAPGGGVRYVPRIRFRLPGGEIVLALTGRGSEEIEFPAGTGVPVLYPAGDPQQARIATLWRLYPRTIALGVPGVLLIDLGLILQILARRSRS